MNFASISWGWWKFTQRVMPHIGDARTASPMINVSNVPGTRQVSFICSTQPCCPAGKGQGSWVKPSWAVPGPAFSTNAYTVSLVLTCVSPTRSRPGSHHPVTSGTCPAGSPEAPLSWTISENLRQGFGGPDKGQNAFSLIPTTIWRIFLFLVSFHHFIQCTRFVQEIDVWDTASPVCVTSHV